jgi:hypothetical protein
MEGAQIWKLAEKRSLANAICLFRGLVISRVFLANWHFLNFFKKTGKGENQLALEISGSVVSAQEKCDRSNVALSHAAVSSKSTIGA